MHLHLHNSSEITPDSCNLSANSNSNICVEEDEFVLLDIFIKEYVGFSDKNLKIRLGVSVGQILQLLGPTMNACLNSLVKYLGQKNVFLESARLNHIINWRIGREMSSLFSGEEDVHLGITVNSLTEPCSDIEVFTSKLEASLKKWENCGRRAIWFKINVSHVQWIPVLAEHGFRIHNGVGDTVTMVRWLPKDEISRVPVYAHTMVGAGAVVITEDANKILTVKERYKQISYWKLPGGYVEPHEDIVDAAMREVLEETNIRTEFQGLISFRHSLEAVFGCSDLYFIVNLKPISFDIKKEKEEVEDVMWMDVTEFLIHPEVHELNRNFVRKCLKYRQFTTISKEAIKHPVTGRLQALYSITNFSDS